MFFQNHFKQSQPDGGICRVYWPEDGTLTGSNILDLSSGSNSNEKFTSNAVVFQNKSLTTVCRLVSYLGSVFFFIWGWGILRLS